MEEIGFKIPQQLSNASLRKSSISRVSVFNNETSEVTACDNQLVELECLIIENIRQLKVMRKRLNELELKTTKYGFDMRKIHKGEKTQRVLVTRIK